ncbi:MAG TPA: hypothetical protein VIV40_08890 [Kofleriaceae bacterium]
MSAAPHAVVTEKELAITDPSVIAAPIETTFDPAHPSGVTPPGAWSFGRLIHNMLPTADRDNPAAASQLVLNWLATWESPQSPNPTVSPARARASIRLMITNPWKAASGCAAPESPATDATCVLDFTQAPFRLMAIMNRPDLRNVAGDDTSIGGEGRFVFQVIGPTLGINALTSALEVMDPTPKPQKFTVIFEYSLPVVHDDGQTITWAQRWHDLGTKPFGTAFNALLLTLTRDFSGPDQDPRRPNGNAIDQVRTNEVALMGARFPTAGFVAGRQVWEIREFHLTETALAPHTMNLEPARDFDIAKATFIAPEGTRSPELIAYLNANAAAVVASRHVLADGMSANASLVGGSPYGAWGKLVNPNPPTIPSQGVESALEGVAIDVRDSFAINTCAGCHRHETDTRHFMHISFVDALEPMTKVDDRARIGAATAPDGTVVFSNFLANEIAPGGARYDDFTQLIVTKRVDLKDKPGLRPCR